MATRKFKFSLSLLARTGRRLHDADPDTPDDNFVTRFQAKLAALGTSTDLASPKS